MPFSLKKIEEKVKEKNQSWTAPVHETQKENWIVCLAIETQLVHRPNFLTQPATKQQSKPNSKNQPNDSFEALLRQTLAKQCSQQKLAPVIHKPGMLE